MELPLSKNRSAKLALGFDDVSLAPSLVTVDPADVDLSFSLGGRTFTLPIMASAMDGVTSPKMLQLYTELGGIAVLNLEGLWGRYEDPEPILERIRTLGDEEVTAYLQEVYSAKPVSEELIARRVKELRELGAYAAVSLTPAGALKFADAVVEAGAELLVIQSTVTSPKHLSSKGGSLSISDLAQNLDIPLLVGNCVGYQVALELMRAGADGILVGVGPGQACTTRGVSGVGVPQITATAEVAAARDDYLAESGRYVLVITDGGMRSGGDICKALAAGADLVMTGSMLAGAPETPAAPYHWGMATPDPALPRGTRVRAKTEAPLAQILFGPAHVTDGTQNLVGAIKSSMGLCGAKNIKEFHKTEIIFSLSFMTEGKALQYAQRVGMGKR